jgi:hypothetical protein
MIGHTAIILIALVVGALVVAAGVTIAYYPNVASVNSSLKDATFSCSYDGYPESGSFKVTVQVDLGNGMNQAEARAVGEKVISHQMGKSGQGVTYALKSSVANSDGSWQVNFDWEYSSMVHDGFKLGHYFDLKVYPANQTVTYMQCD